MSRQPLRKPRRIDNDVRYVRIPGTTDVYMIYTPPNSNVRTWERISAAEIPPGAVVNDGFFAAAHATEVSNIVSSFVAKNSLPLRELPDFISKIHSSISQLRVPVPKNEFRAAKADEAQIKKSITPDALISFEDRKPYKTLKRHLTIRGLSPEAYRTKHGLPVDYPMTSASYSARRSELARALGLGNSRKGQTKAAAKAAEPEETASEASAQAKPKRAGRPRKAAAAE